MAKPKPKRPTKPVGSDYWEVGSNDWMVTTPVTQAESDRQLKEAGAPRRQPVNRPEREAKVVRAGGCLKRFVGKPLAEVRKWALRAKRKLVCKQSMVVY